MIPSISFGSKIPVSTYSIYNSYNNDYENVTMYCLDCKDESDIYEVKSAVNLYNYTEKISALMQLQYLYYLSKKYMPPDIWEKYCGEDKPNCIFYVTKNQAGETIGVCQTIPDENEETIDFFETNQYNYYKYVGQGMVASLGKIKLKNNDNAEINVYRPSNGAIGFYKKCGFVEIAPNYFSMGQKGIKKLVDDFENKTKNEIVIH